MLGTRRLYQSGIVLMGMVISLCLAPSASAQLFHRHHQIPACQSPPVCCPAPSTVEIIPIEPPTEPPKTKPKDEVPPQVTDTTPITDFPGLGDETFGAALGSQTVAAAFGGTGVSPISAPGYLHSAVPQSQFRLRVDSAYNNNRPDRAEFFYAKCGCFRNPTMLPNGRQGPPIDPDAPGPPLPETSVDYQDIYTYLEWAPTRRFSSFVDVPVRFLNPDNNANTAGLANINFGFKYAFLYQPWDVASIQLRIGVPSGDADRGLGNDLVSFEPSLLYYRQLTDNFWLNGQFGIWVPAGGTDFAGNILNYGVAATYVVFDNSRFRIAPVAEVLGWTVLDGKEFAFPEDQILDASGDTIVNAKIGMHIGFGPRGDQGILGRSSLYFGYGRALTGAVWYEDIYRLEYRLNY